MRHCLKHMNRCEASVDCCDFFYCSRYFRRSYERIKLPRISVKWIIRITRGCSFGYTDSYILFSMTKPRLVMQHLNDTFPNRWIGSGSTINRPPRSPHLTPLNFCLWGWVKSEVYRRKVDTWDELLDRIMDAISRIKERQDELRRATRHVLTRVAKCIDVDVGIFENVL
jgi:hypothetical protein